MMRQKCLNEVVHLHQFIQDWLKGSVPKTGHVFSRFEDVLDDDFVIVHPTGSSESRDELIKSFWSAHGAKESTFSIEIRNPCIRFSIEPFVILTYEEWQHDLITAARISTAVFTVRKDEHEVKWAHLHETWIPG